VVDRVAAGEMPARTPNTITTPTRLLEELERTRRRGYAIDEGENEAGIRCVGAPVFDVRGVTAAISVSAPSFRFTAADLERTAPLVVEAARRVSAALGGAPPADEASTAGEPNSSLADVPDSPLGGPQPISGGVAAASTRRTPT
jgi:hypothetical protein